jgi:hypothetical protein
VDRVTRGEGGRGGGEGCLCRRNRRRRVDQAVQKGDFIWTSGKMRFVAKAERKGGGVFAGMFDFSKDIWTAVGS